MNKNKFYSKKDFKMYFYDFRSIFNDQFKNMKKKVE